MEVQNELKVLPNNMSNKLEVLIKKSEAKMRGEQKYRSFYSNSPNFKGAEQLF